jgi:hypothetical protein
MPGGQANCAPGIKSITLLFLNSDQRYRCHSGHTRLARSLPENGPHPLRDSRSASFLIYLLYLRFPSIPDAKHDRNQSGRRDSV